jgi:ribosomal protein S18 acetylase RimI-like enzyme
MYVAVTSPVPHCRFMPSVAMFGSSLMHPRNSTTQILVAEASGTVGGFAAVQQLGQDEAGVLQAAITPLFFTDDAAGQALLEACEGHVRQGDAERILAFPAAHGKCPIPSYNSGWDGLSDRIPTTMRLLARNGYTPYYRELHLTCDFERFPPRSDAVPDGIMLEEETDEHGVALHAVVNGRKAGTCGYNTLQRLSDEPAAARWGYVGWLGVEEPFRRRGIARYLITSAMARMQTQGCEGCWLTTGADNWPAQPLYLSLGFEVEDCSACFRKVLNRT